MTAKRLALFFAALVAVFALSASAWAVFPSYATTTNWAGYAALQPTTANGFTSISATFTVPTVTPSVGDSYSGMWIGFDGLLAGDTTVEQIGVLADYVSGAPQYLAFYELFPNDTVILNAANGFAFNVRAGDSVSASILFNGVVNGADSYTFNIVNNTRNKSVTVTDSPGGFNRIAARSSAEFIFEDPTVGFGLAQLNQVGSVSFTNASATLDGTLTGPITAFPHTQLDMVSAQDNSIIIAHTSPLDDTGASFTVSIPEPSLLAFGALASLFLARRRRA